METFSALRVFVQEISLTKASDAELWCFFCSPAVAPFTNMV